MCLKYDFIFSVAGHLNSIKHVNKLLELEKCRDINAECPYKTLILFCSHQIWILGSLNFSEQSNSTVTGKPICSPGLCSVVWQSHIRDVRGFMCWVRTVGPHLYSHTPFLRIEAKCQHILHFDNLSLLHLTYKWKLVCHRMRSVWIPSSASNTLIHI